MFPCRGRGRILGDIALQVVRRGHCALRGITLRRGVGADRYVGCGRDVFKEKSERTSTF